MRALLLVFCAAAGAFARPAGFDCSKASTEVERYICANDEISGLDALLNKAYASGLKAGSPKGKEGLRKSQREWTRGRDECLENYPAEAYFCVLKAYRSRILELGATSGLVAFYDAECAADEWDCDYAGDLAVRLGRNAEAIRYYSVLCKADRDGDQGRNCFKKASVLEKTGRLREAKELYARTCENRSNNEACGATLRLEGTRMPGDRWSGLYRSAHGTLFMRVRPDGKFRVEVDTRWDNGHQCGYNGTGLIRNDKAVLDPEPKDGIAACKPKLLRKGDTLSITDPSGDCINYCGFRGQFEGTFVRE
jgi:uncharacterized protein